MGVFTFETDKAIVKIHDGKLTAEERRAVMEAAAKIFIRDVQKAGRLRNGERVREVGA